MCRPWQSGLLPSCVTTYLLLFPLYYVIMCPQLLSPVQLFATAWTVAHQAPLSVEFSSGLLFPSPEDLPDPGNKPMSLGSPASAGRFFTS